MKETIKVIDITQPVIAEEVLRVQRLAYKVEADLIGFVDLPPLKQTIKELEQSEETFYGFYTNGQLSGVVSLKIEDRVMDISRLFVHPEQFRKGIAKKLIAFVQKYEKGFEEIFVSTAADNQPAVLFYVKNGFSVISEVKTIEGLALAQFRKML